ncbi:MAG: signal recognition particle-docking protein FtsY [Dehalococcoidia bacterium]|nr:signal recognition particle-docking protein FtsY [Dehalococcoidia bacterium]
MLSIFKRDPNKNRKQTIDGIKRTKDSWFGQIFGMLRNNNFDEGIWDELEEILISADVGVSTSADILDALKSSLKTTRSDDPDATLNLLKNILHDILKSSSNPKLWSEDHIIKPYVILMIGVNGVGKTTSIAKLAHFFAMNNKKVILGAADTSRAAAAEQLIALGQKLNLDVISHNQGSDPGAVAYDSYQAAKARAADVLIIDTAGRLHNKSNLMEELKKISRVLSRLDETAPHQTILTIDATTGHNGLEQARAFNEAIGCTGIFLSKLDGTARGGIILAIHDELKIPILFIGTGESIEDLAPFEPIEFVDELLSAPA